jgi:thiol:disulfide interchange protein DsbD
MKFCRHFLAAALVALTAQAQSTAPASPVGVLSGGSPFASAPEHVQWDVVAEVAACAPSQPFWVAVRAKIEPPWHIYWINYGDTGEVTNLTWTLPAGWKAGPVQWPTPQRQLFGSLMDYIYEGSVLLLTQITPSADLRPGATVNLQAHVHWMECADVCLVPTDKTLSLDLPTAVRPQTNGEIKPLLEQALAALPQPPAMLNVSAWRQGDELFIGLIPKADATVPAELKDVYFFSADGQTKPAAPQVLQKAAQGWVLALSRIASAPSDAKMLPGVLTVAGSWTTSGTVPALAINPPLADAAPAALAGVVKVPGTAVDLGSLLGILILGFLGGLILNIMPCVFPVLAIKVLGFVKQAGAERRRVVLHGLTYAGGVLASMWTLVGVLLALRAGGAQLGWGFQLQQPAFVLGLAIFFLLFALSLSGVFEIGGSLIGLGSGLTAKDGLGGSFFQGMLAVVVATPCTAPLLAPALGAAFALPTWQALLAFTCIALGLATPYLLLSLFPGLAQRLPRPGAWMETFKQFMAFPLYATVAFLLFTLNGQVSAERFLNVTFALVVVAMAAWFYGRYATPAASRTRRRIGQVGALLLFAAGTVWAYWPAEDLNWEPWSADRVKELQKEGRPIYVDFTARWCVTCRVNKDVVFYSTTRVVDAFNHAHVALLRADLTKPDPLITAELARRGRAAVPLDLLYLPGHAEPIELPSLLTPDIVLDALNGKTVPPATP